MEMLIIHEKQQWFVHGKIVLFHEKYCFSLQNAIFQNKLNSHDELLYFILQNRAEAFNLAFNLGGFTYFGWV